VFINGKYARILLILDRSQLSGWNFWIFDKIRQIDVQNSRCINKNLFFKLRYWEVIQKFNEALEFTPNDAKIHEMKAQV